MKTIFVSDIFGRTDALERLVINISEEALILDPYGSAFMEFKSEHAAYTYFSENVGHISYAKKLKHVLQEQQDEVFLIGFSIGASAIWNISGDQSVSVVKSTICYYGSQIRNNLSCSPAFPIGLVFPSMESHFSVDEVIHKLSDKQNVSIRKVPYLHGFMNELSINYHPHGYNEEVQELCKSVIQQIA
ncbi:MAG: dienelactone hydrolase family protein [Gammaproteobacteria bacterium]|nr:dienelactone hydrolase family protein [Gammaproteobacteria bacterium]MBU2240554.1 dienelactone hydrolase family protein [Gammaproteobacteria bacterium]MBU2320710.1 dienelactone hydrolase family protein [Gammaproteobacteria bacterium]MBU2415053.1 dienelactone hydrolase family protein [Gammaproteobacteria bacterium]